MTDLYLGIGHGTTPTGVYDPGAVALDGTQEHELAHHVVDAAVAALKRSGVSFQAETDKYGDAHADDPNYVGSTSRANAAKVKCAVEVHFDWAHGVEGYAGQYSGSKSRALSEAIRKRFTVAKLPVKSDVDRTGELYFLDHTTMPALIPEMNVVADYTNAGLTEMGEALAAGICDWLGKTYLEPGGDDVLTKDAGTALSFVWGMNERWKKNPKPDTAPDMGDGGNHLDAAKSGWNYADGQTPGTVKT